MPKCVIGLIKINLGRESPFVFPRWLACSVTRLGDFCKFFVTKYRTKVAQLLNEYFGLFEKHKFFSKNFCLYFLGNFGNFWATFYSNIWSRCQQWHDDQQLFLLIGTHALFIPTTLTPFIYLFMRGGNKHRHLENNRPLILPCMQRHF